MDAGIRQAWQAARPNPQHAEIGACVAPWVSIEFDPSGWVYACCTSGMYPLGRIGEQRLTDLWGGPRAQVLRDAMQRWDLTVACGPCRWHLEHGRMDPVAAVYDQYPVASGTPERPYMMLFALSNRCNLGCVMCSPELSTTLRAEAGLPLLPSPYDDEFFDDLEPLLADLRLAKFLGGEPFLAPEHHRVWKMMDRLPNPPRLQITTNGTIWTPEVEWVLDRFDCDISISIDAATAPTYEAIRRGGDHAKLMRNIDRFADACARNGTELHVSYCLMNMNWQELGDFLVWAERFAVPASVNLVTDLGLALHDATAEDLSAVHDAWTAESAGLEGRLAKNADVWRTQLAQLESVIDERRAGRPSAPRQGRRADGSELRPARQPADPPNGWRGQRARRHALESRARDERDRLEAWSGGGPVGVVETDAAGSVVAVPAPHSRLGLDAARLVGRRIEDLVGRMEEAVGRAAWLVEAADVDDAVVRTIALANQRPVRGTRGTLVRVVALERTGGWVHLIAEDRIYDRKEPSPVASPTPVELGNRPAVA